MNLKNYKQFVKSNVNEFPIDYYFLKLAAEAGEVAQERGRLLTKQNDTDVYMEKVKLELGDVMWYIMAICIKYGWQLEDILSENVYKLKERYKLE